VWESADLPAGTHSIRVTRTADRAFVVRGGSALFADGGAVLDDYEIPVGVAVSYVAEAFDSDGVSLGTVDALSGSVASDPSKGWVSDPTDPSSVIQVELKGDFGSQLTRVRQVQTYQVGDRLVSLLGARGKLTQVPLRMQTKTLADADALDAILGQSVVLIRVPPPVRVPRNLYVVVATTNELDQNVQYGQSWVIWDITGDEIDATTLDILVPVVTYQDYMDAFPLYSDAMAAYATYFDAIKNPPV